MKFMLINNSHILELTQHLSMLNDIIEECIQNKRSQELIPIRTIPRFSPTENNDYDEIVLDLNFFW